MAYAVVGAKAGFGKGERPMRTAALTLIAVFGLATVWALPARAAPMAPNLTAEELSSIVPVWGGCGWGWHPTYWGGCAPNRHYGYYRPDWGWGPYHDHWGPYYGGGYYPGWHHRYYYRGY